MSGKEILAILSVFGVLLLILLLAVGEHRGPGVAQEINDNKNERHYDFGLVKTLGHYSYIPINKTGNPADMVDLVLETLNKFEVEHPELRIRDWNIEKQQNAHTTGRYVYGLWITHAPAKKENQ